MKIRLVLVNISLLLISLALSLAAAYWIAETFFFDKLFYQKSVAHGYWTTKALDDGLISFGKRGKDLLELREKLASNEADKLQVLGQSIKTRKDQPYTIVIIGDSYVWGQGVKEKDRFVNILKKKLNKDKPTIVLSLAECGDSIVEYFSKYSYILRNNSVDLVIFSLGSNDLLVNKVQPRYIPNTVDADKIVSYCEKKYPNDLLIQHGVDDEKSLESYNQAVVNSFESKSNLCVLEEILARLPKRKAKSIYFLTDDYLGNRVDYRVLRMFLGRYMKNVVSSEVGITMPKYSKYWSDNLWEYFSVSNLEQHPSKLAYQMYADILYEEIVSNPEYGFVQE